MQAPLLHLWSEAATPPATLLARFLPPTVAALLPADLVQVWMPLCCAAAY